MLEREFPTVASTLRMDHPIVAGWMNYYGRFNRSPVYPLRLHTDASARRSVRC
ncbi:hypothetical protein [Micromonospora sp. LOL_023]|uniref:hypothetical protein n=1 Tax=Micromonospora sp. LOL_023 TaxID=3345418 RepID=UPI003A88274D